MRLISLVGTDAATRRTGRFGSEEGSAIVEFAFSFIILAIMLIGIMELGLALYTFNFVSEAAREASRYASVRGSACINFSDCQITQTQLTSVVQNMGYPGINPSSLTVTPTWPTGNTPGNPVIVNVSYQFPLGVPFITQTTWTLQSTSQMVISQ